jgi:hypothetical protein
MPFKPVLLLHLPVGLSHSTGTVCRTVPNSIVLYISGNYSNGPLRNCVTCLANWELGNAAQSALRCMLKGAQFSRFCEMAPRFCYAELQKRPH